MQLLKHSIQKKVLHAIVSFCDIFKYVVTRNRNNDFPFQYIDLWHFHPTKPILLI